MGALLARSVAAGPDGGAAILATIPAEEVRELEAGRIVLLQGGEGRRVAALVIFDQPAPRVMLLLSQVERQTEYRPELKGDATVATYPDGLLEKQRLRILFTRIEYFVRYRIDPQALRITWGLDPMRHNDLRKVSGAWELYALGSGRTLGRFATEVDVGRLPAFLQDYATREQVPTVLENARRWVDSDGHWRP